ncbi:MAG: YigZ family protein [Eubacteriales bacterium]|nr:YigZ family protein [Eubacteriales bacterium]
MPDSQGLRAYQTIQHAAESEIVISKSRFLGYCVPVSSEAEAQEALSQIRKRHYDARHCCYAFRLQEGGIARSSDDGEPSGTAGAPILAVLNGAGVENVLCAVVRYFGGVLLGTGGLVRAYGKTASEALQAAEIVPILVCERILVSITYPAYQLIEPLIRQKGYPCEAEFTQEVALKITLPAKESETLIQSLVDRTDGTAKITRLGQSLEAYKPKTAN